MSDAGKPSGPGTFVITREALRDGSHLARLRAAARPDFPIRSDLELEASLDDVLVRHPPGTDAWVFGYGSLMWNPAFDYVEQRTGTVRGLHRRFCLTLIRGRGSPAHPGLMLALDRGGTCRGMAFRIAADHVRAEMLLIWRREMLSGAYLARWVRVESPAGPVAAVTFVANPRHARYAGALSTAATAARIRTAAGELGTCLDYFERTVEALHALGFRDAALERIETEIHKPAPTA